MEERIVQFIAHLRAEGVRISLAESLDAGQALLQLHQLDPTWFRAALRSTLIKAHTDQPIFDTLFPLYFGPDVQPLTSIEKQLTPDQQQLANETLKSAGQRLRFLLAGKTLPFQEMDQAARQARAKPMWGPVTQSRLQREMLRQLDLQEPGAELEQFLKNLGEMGLSPAAVANVRTVAVANQSALAAQSAQFMDHITNRQAASKSVDLAALMRRSFHQLSEVETQTLRQQVRRLGTKLRASAARRQKQGRGPRLDAKTTLRASLRTSGIPFTLHFKKKQTKPKFVLFCDVSTSMRPVAEFMLRLMYEMQDQLARVRSFGYNAHIEEVSNFFVGQPPATAIRRVLQHMPPGRYATDLGQALAEFWAHHLDAVDRQTTVLILSDGRNNRRDPRLDLFQQLKRRARRVIWFNSEPQKKWGSGDSDVLRYQPYCHAVHQVSNLAELTAAIDSLFSTR